MIYATNRVTELRFCADHPPGAAMPPYYLSCNLIWESPTVVWVTMMTGAFKRHCIRELEDWLRERGVTLVKAHRVQGHVLPGFRSVAEHYERPIHARSVE